MTTQLLSFVGLKPNGYQFDIARYPDTDFPIQSVSIPGITSGTATQNTPQITIKHPGEKVSYSPLTAEFMINSNMSNYIQLFSWLRANAAPMGPTDFASLQLAFAQNATNDNGQERFSDIDLILLDNNNSPIVNFTFVDAFPVALSELIMTTMANGTEYLTCTATFDYTEFTINAL